MTSGDKITVVYNGKSKDLVVVSVDQQEINRPKYTLYNLLDSSRNNYKLYVREGISISNPLNVDGHLIKFEHSCPIN